jgi:hypothetical protein
LTWAKGLNSNRLHPKTAVCNPLKRYGQIDIFPDRQVVAMSGNGPTQRRLARHWLLLFPVSPGLPRDCDQGGRQG